MRGENATKTPYPDSTEKRRKKLNEYQKFVRKESHSNKYKNMKGSERMNAIASLWKSKSYETKYKKTHNTKK